MQQPYPHHRQSIAHHGIRNVPECQGWLVKQSGGRLGLGIGTGTGTGTIPGTSHHSAFRTWRKRWFELGDSALYYYQEKGGRTLSGMMSMLTPIDIVVMPVPQSGPASASSPSPHGGRVCRDCKTPFNALMIMRRKHQCHACGYEFCDQCTTKSVKLFKYGMYTPQRVCNECYQKTMEEYRTDENFRKIDMSINAAGSPRKGENTQQSIAVFTAPHECKPFLFAIKNRERELWLSAETEEERNRWLHAFNAIQQRRMHSWKQTQAGGTMPMWEVQHSDIEYTRLIGEGSFGSVYRGRLFGTEVAIKRLKEGNSSIHHVLNELKKEISILSKLRHPNVVLYIGACTKPPEICIITEWCARGSLQDIIHNHNIVLSARQIVDAALGIAQGMSYLHSQNVTHGDLKPGNILITNNWSMKVADFGLSQARSRQSVAANIDAPSMNGRCFGSPEFIAPELWNGLPYDSSIDVYSCGILLAEMVSRLVPYNELRITCPEDVQLAVVNDGAIPSLPEWCEPFIQPMILNCLSRNPHDRPSFADILFTLQRLADLDDAFLFYQLDLPRIREMLLCSTSSLQQLAATEIAQLADSCRIIRKGDHSVWPIHSKLAQADERTIAESYVIEDDDAISILESLTLILDHDHYSLQVAATVAILSMLRVCDTAKFVHDAAIVRNTGAIPKLVRLFNSTDAGTLQRACAQLITLLFSDVVVQQSLSLDSLPLDDSLALLRILIDDSKRLQKQADVLKDAISSNENMQRCLCASIGIDAAQLSDSKVFRCNAEDGDDFESPNMKSILRSSKRSPSFVAGIRNYLYENNLLKQNLPQHRRAVTQASYLSCKNMKENFPHPPFVSNLSLSTQSPNEKTPLNFAHANPSANHINDHDSGLPGSNLSFSSNGIEALKEGIIDSQADDDGQVLDMRKNSVFFKQFSPQPLPQKSTAKTQDKKMQSMELSIDLVCKLQQYLQVELPMSDTMSSSFPNCFMQSYVLLQGGTSNLPWSLCYALLNDDGILYIFNDITSNPSESLEQIPCRSAAVIAAKSAVDLLLTIESSTLDALVLYCGLPTYYQSWLHALQECCGNMDADKPNPLLLEQQRLQLTSQLPHIQKLPEGFPAARHFGYLVYQDFRRRGWQSVFALVDDRSSVLFLYESHKQASELCTRFDLSDFRVASIHEDYFTLQQVSTCLMCDFAAASQKERNCWLLCLFGKEQFCSLPFSEPSIAPFMLFYGHADHWGLLWRKKKFGRDRWVLEFCVLVDDQIHCFNDNAANPARPGHSIYICRYNGTPFAIHEYCKRPFAWSIHDPSRTFLLAAADESSFFSWISAIRHNTSRIQKDHSRMFTHGQMPASPVN